MTDDLRPCRVSSCEAVHSRTLFCCRRHWRVLPMNLRDAIWSAYRRHGVASEEYTAAAVAADEYLAGYEANRLARAGGGVWDSDTAPF